MSGAVVVAFLASPVVARASHENGLLNRRDIFAAFDEIDEASDLSGDVALGIVRSVGCDSWEEALEREIVEFLTLEMEARVGERLDCDSATQWISETHTTSRL
jgi:hypothetical protein